MIQDNIRRKIKELITRSTGLIGLAESGMARDTNHLVQCRGWIAEALNVIQLAIPSPNNAYRVQIETKWGGGEVHRVASIAQMLDACCQISTPGCWEIWPTR
jgi:hypothetical protein